MTLKDVYQRFLDLPNPLSLAENASLHYITTLTTFSQSGNIIRHLESQKRTVVKTRSAKVISAVEGPNALALEIETCLEFISGGGAYLPGLENFIVDKTATIPTTHIVHFDAQQKIIQVRISWDQASLLRQTEVIGSRGKNWPVFDGKDQIRLINTSAHAAPATAAPTTAPEWAATPRGRSENQSIVSSRNVSPSKKHIKDPYASLDLFSPKVADENQPMVNPNPVQPRASARPPPREMSELFAAGHEDHEPGSPKKPAVQPVVASKGAGSQKFAPPRLFSEESDEPAAVGYKSNPAKYNHFHLGDVVEDDPMQHRESNTNHHKTAIPLRAKSDKHLSQWDFDDFNTPAKIAQKVRGQDVVHFSLNNDSAGLETPDAKNMGGKGRRDNDSHFELRDDGTPVQRHVVPKPRKDAESHFQLKDEDTPAPNRTSDRPSTSSSADNRPGGLYHNLFDADNSVRPQDKAPLATITSNTFRKNDFDSHWGMSDASPAAEKANNENNHAGGDHKKATDRMDSQWDNYDHDQSPDQVKKVAAQHAHQRKGMQSHWGFGDDATPTRDESKEQKNYWDF